MNQLDPISNDIFGFETELRLGGGIRLDGRMVIVRRGDSLWVHSPLPLACGWADPVVKLGTVRFLVAPNAYHHLYLGEAIEAFPEALLCATAPVVKKRTKLDFGYTLGSGALPDGWPEGLRPIAVDGAAAASEFLFFDQPSGSLLVTDLLFNNRRPTNWISRTFVRMTSGWDRPARSRIWRFLIRDKAAFAASMAPLTEMTIARVIPAHGQLIDDPALAISLIQTGKAA